MSESASSDACEKEVVWLHMQMHACAGSRTLHHMACSSAPRRCSMQECASRARARAYMHAHANDGANAHYHTLALTTCAHAVTTAP